MYKRQVIDVLHLGATLDLSIRKNAVDASIKAVAIQKLIATLSLSLIVSPSALTFPRKNRLENRANPKSLELVIITSA